MFSPCQAGVWLQCGRQEGRGGVLVFYLQFVCKNTSHIYKPHSTLQAMEEAVETSHTQYELQNVIARLATYSIQCTTLCTEVFSAHWVHWKK
jgi:hypothetical protein